MDGKELWLVLLGGWTLRTHTGVTDIHAESPIHVSQSSFACWALGREQLIMSGRTLGALLSVRFSLSDPFLAIQLKAKGGSY